jgi:uncharacterized protein (DUF1501 family)
MNRNDRHAPPSGASRRAWLRHAGALSASLATAGLAQAAQPLALALSTAGQVSSLNPGRRTASGAGDDFKALVCVYLNGGADNANLLIPFEAGEHARYASARGDLALPRHQMLAFAPASQGGRRLAVHQELSALKNLYDRRRLAFVANVGPLSAPTSLADYRAGSARLPERLFSHNDQQAAWQAMAAEGARDGWGGRLADLVADGGDAAAFAAIALDGRPIFLSGQRVRPARVGVHGAIDASPWTSRQAPALHGSAVAAEAFAQLVHGGGDAANLIEREYALTRHRGLAVNTRLANELARVPATSALFPRTPLGEQLAMVGRLLLARRSLAQRRQVFFVAVNGFDHHSKLLDAGNGHLVLMRQVADALAAFDTWLSAAGLADRVTTFTASEFGRTLASNGDGSDHGWGSHHLVMGGAVRGGDVYGRMPDVALNTESDVGRGSLLPTTSVDQLAATLALWFGVPESSLALVAPNIARFGSPNLGFMA